MNKCIITFSHSNYLISTGGTEKFINDIIKIYKEKNIDNIHFFPINRINKFSSRLNKRFIGVIFNGKFIGVYPEKKIYSILNEIRIMYRYKFIGVHIHHLYGWERTALSEILVKINMPIIFFVHDFELIKSSSMTGNQDQELNFQSAKNFFHKINNLLLKIIVPSIFVRDNWISYFPNFEDITEIRGHLKLEGLYCKKNINKPIKVAYIGALSKHKGSKEWYELVNNLDPTQYEYYYFGKSVQTDNRIINRKVDFQNSNDTLSMEEMLRKDNIDIVFMWSMLPETYSYTYYEAWASGAYILTNSKSGNICQMVKKVKSGKVFETFTQSLDYLNEEKKVLLDLIKYYEYCQSPNKLLPNNDIDDLSFDYKDSHFRYDQNHSKIKKNRLLTVIYERYQKVK